MIQVCVFPQRRIKAGGCGMHLASVTPDLGWTSYLDPWGSSFPSAGRVMLSLQRAMPRSTQPAEDFSSLDWSACFAFPTKPFSEIYSAALVLIGAAHWGGILQTFVNVSTKLVGLSCKGEKWDLSWGQKMKRYRNLKQSLSFSSVTQLWLWMCLHWISHRFDRYFGMFPCCSSEKY